MTIEFRHEYDAPLRMELHFSNVDEKERFLSDFLIWRELKGVLPPRLRRSKKGSNAHVLHDLAHMLWIGQQERPYRDVLKETSILFKFFKSFLVNQTESMIELLEDENHASDHRFFTESNNPVERTEELGEERIDETHSSGIDAVL